MPRLEDLRQSLKDMTPEQLREKMRQIRADRRISKAPIKKKKEAVKKAQVQKTKAKRLMDTLPAVELLKLLEEMEQ